MRIIRILALIMALLVCISAFASCNGKDEETTTAEQSSESETPSESETGTPAVERFDYFNTDLSEYAYIDKNLYSNLAVELSSDYVIDEKDVQTYIDARRLENKTAVNGDTQVTDQPIQKGDAAFIYYKGFLDGEEFEGGSNWDDEKPFELVIGSGSFIPGFEDGLIGLIPANTSRETPFSLDVTFPENYYENLAGKAVVFHVYVAYSVQYQLPDYNEAFITETLEYTPSGSNIKEEFEEHILTQLKAEMKSYEKSEILNQIWEQILAETQILVYPEEEIEYYYNSYLSQYEYYMNYYSYLGYNFKTLDEFVVAYLGLEEGADWKAETRESCKIDVAQNLAFHYIAQKESITVTDADYQTSVQYYVDFYTAQGYTYTAEEVENGLGSDYIKQHALFEKVNTLLATNCSISYAD